MLGGSLSEVLFLFVETRVFIFLNLLENNSMKNIVMLNSIKILQKDIDFLQLRKFKTRCFFKEGIYYV